MKTQTKIRQIRALYRLAKHLTKRRFVDYEMPYKFEFLVTERCNSRCTTCGIWRNGHPQSDIDLQNYERALDSLTKETFWLSLSGGEPSLHPHFSAMLKLAMEKLPNLVLLNFGTNGLNPERIFQAVKEALGFPIPFFMVAISVDAIGERNDEIRGRAGAFDAAMETAERLTSLERSAPQLQVSFQTTISPLNRGDEAVALHRYLKKRFPMHPHISTVATNSYLVARGENEALKATILEEQTTKRLIDDTSIDGIFSLLPLSYLGLSEQFLKDGESPVRCVAGDDMAIIRPNGDVHACDYLQEPLGNLNAVDWNLVHFFQLQETKQRIEKLASCRLCFSPCQAYPSLMRAPEVTLSGVLKALVMKYGKRRL